MKRKQLIDEVARRAEISKNDAAKCLNAVLGAIADNLTEGDKDIAIPDFGHFAVKHVPERKGKIHRRVNRLPSKHTTKLRSRHPTISVSIRANTAKPESSRA